MNFIYKKCDVCNTKTNKLQKVWNIYLLKTGKKIQCPNCNTEYKTNTFISFIGSFYTWGGISIFVLIILTSIIWDLFEKIFNKNFGAEIWLYTFFILSLIEFFIIIILPLNKINNKKKE